ncbi:MAG: ribbon-helix-helix domain-containing protein [Pseudomonadota bacterium]
MIKRSIAIDGHRTSIALEAEFWSVIDALAAARGESLASFVGRLDSARVSEGPTCGLASYLRVAALKAALDPGQSQFAQTAPPAVEASD